MRIVKLFALLLFALSAACGDSAASRSAQKTSEPSFAINDKSSSNSSTTAGNAAPALAVGRETAPGGGAGGGNRPASNPAAQNISLTQTLNSQIDTTPTDRKIVRNAELNLEADSPEQSQQKITAIAESKGGFVVESQQSSSDTKMTTRDVVTMTVRVPAQKFAEAVDEIRKTASRVIVETVKGEDVTEEFIDIEARLKAKKALELQFMEIMKRANNVEDALSVQSQLADVRGEIEKVEGRKRFLENQASLSTIKLRLQTPTAFSASSSGFSYRLGESFSTGIDFALNFVLGLVTFLLAILPFALFIGLPGFFLIRYMVRKQNRPRSVIEIAKEEI